MKTRTLHQTVKFKASPTQVYEMLMDYEEAPIVVWHANQDQQKGWR
jgi:hypothetical protein